jgi:hypothetical protein
MSTGTEAGRETSNDSDIAITAPESQIATVATSWTELVRKSLDAAPARSLYSLLHAMTRTRNAVPKMFMDIPLGDFVANMRSEENSPTSMLLWFFLPGDTHARRKIIIGIDGSIRGENEDEEEKVLFGRAEKDFDTMPPEHIVSGTLAHLTNQDTKPRTGAERLASIIERLRGRPGFPDSNVRIVSGMPRMDEIGFGELAAFDPNMENNADTSYLV